jgi:ribosomal protein S18 acetylase RimI-like enzyme
METETDIQVRPARPADFAEAGRVTALAYQEFMPAGDVDDDWGMYLGQIADVAGRVDRTTVLVAVDPANGRVLGSVTIEEEDVIGDDDSELESGASHIRMLGVDPNARGRGVGRALMEASIDRARALGKRFVTLRTTERMKAAQGMYVSLGFELDPGHDLVFDDGFHLIAYRLVL